MIVHQHESARYESANRESAKCGKPNIYNNNNKFNVKSGFLQLIKSQTSSLLLLLYYYYQ